MPFAEARRCNKDHRHLQFPLQNILGLLHSSRQIGYCITHCCSLCRSWIQHLHIDDLSHQTFAGQVVENIADDNPPRGWFLVRPCHLGVEHRDQDFSHLRMRDSGRVKTITSESTLSIGMFFKNVESISKA